MTTKQIDLLNIGLMLVALSAAFAVPFELFLFSYAILGPLHYLTEITWLHKRDYFTTSKFDFVWLIVLCIFATLFVVIFTEYSNIANLLIFVAFFSALAMVLFKNVLLKLIFIAVATAIGTAISESPPFFFLFAIFLPTLIHVFLFTGLFMISGAIKSKSVPGAAALIVFIFCGAICFVVKPDFAWYKVTAYAQSSMIESGFVQVNQAIIYLLSLGTNTREAVFSSAVGLGIMRFIAFAYTYHYLNWFSKTSVIKWHEVPKHWFITVMVLWVASVGLYIYDYRTGLIALYFLSMLHVFLEFPLNYRSVQHIGESVWKLMPLSASRFRR